MMLKSLRKILFLGVLGDTERSPLDRKLEQEEIRDEGMDQLDVIALFP